MRRRVHVYDDYDDIETLQRRVSELNRAGKMDKEIAATLNSEGFVGARGCRFRGDNVWLLRKRWGLRPSKSMGLTPIRRAGRTEPIRSRAPPLRWGYFTNDLQISQARPPDRPPNDERTAMANRTRRPPDPQPARSSSAHQTIEDEGSMKASVIPTLADAILDRVIHNAYRIELAGESLRKQRPTP